MIETNLNDENGMKSKKTIESINLISINSDTKSLIERKEWVSKVSGSSHEAWFRGGKMVSVDFNRDGSITVTSGIGYSLRINTKHYVRM